MGSGAVAGEGFNFDSAGVFGDDSNATATGANFMVDILPSLWGSLVLLATAMIRRNGVRMSVRERISKQSVTRKGHSTITLMLNGYAYSRCVSSLYRDAWE